MGVDITLKEDFIHGTQIYINFLGKPSICFALPAKFVSNNSANMNRRTHLRIDLWLIKNADPTISLSQGPRKTRNARQVKST